MDDMLWIAIESGSNKIFQELTRTISYFGMTIGDNTGRVLDVPRLVDDDGPPQRVAGDEELTGIGFQLFLTLPDVLFKTASVSKLLVATNHTGCSIESKNTHVAATAPAPCLHLIASSKDNNSVE